MAKQIEDIVVQLGIKGFEELNKLRSSFRELTKVTKGTDEQLDDARKRLLELKTELGDTARANKGLTDAFTALVGEAKRGSTVWQDLNRDLSKLRQEARLTDTQITALRDIIIDESKVHAQSAVSIREHIKSLQDLRNQASLNGKVHQQLGADIQKLTATLEEGAVSNRKHYSSLTQILGVKPDAVLRQWEAYTRILQEGTASADKLAVAQRRLNQLSGAPRILERRRITSSAEITQDPEYLRRFGFEGASLPTLPSTNAAYAQQIKELQQDLQHLDRSSIQYLQTVMQLAGVQRQATEVIRGYAQALVMGLDTKVVERSSRNLQEAITALRAEMQQLDTTTAEGSATYAANANSVRNLEQELKKLGDSYRHVGDMATQAATAEQNAANARIRNNYLNRSLVAQQEQALVDLGQRVRAGVSGTPLLLPAAGQTSAPGTGAARSGGARLLVGQVETTFGPSGGQAPTRGTRAFLEERAALRGAELPSAAVGVPPAGVGQLAAQFDNLGKSTERARRPLRDIFVDIDKTTKASNGSVNSLDAQIGVWTELRNAVGRTAPAFDTATKKLEQLTARRERLTGGRRLSGMQLAQGVGAALSGGIFGGPEGLIGGLGGLAVGGVGGAFAGAAFGAQVGMFRQQLGAVTEYSARIDKLQIALRGIVGSQDAYSQALAAAASVTRDLNIPQESAIQGMTRLSAAVKGAGGTVTDSAFAFRAISEAVKATGGDAEQADGALLALTQVFSKGKVSAEELNQIAERLPGTFTLFAKAAGKTGPELQKALQEGQVGLNDLMKFLQLISTEYGKTALKIAASSQEAGARLSVAMQDMQLAVGRALQPVGALLQDAFAAFIRSTTPALVLSAKLIGGGITNMYNAFASGINILVSLRGVFENLAKTMLVFGGITAGVFVASNITTFTNALKGALAVLRTLLSVEKALLVIENARIAAQAILAGLTTGATKGKILGAILGGAAGVGAVIGIGKLVEGVIGDIEKGLSGALKGVDLKLPTLSKFPTPSAGSDKAAKDAEKERKKAAEEALRQQTWLNRLLQEQLRLNYEAGAVDADALSKLDAEATLLKLITRLKIDEVTLSAKTRQEREQGIINLTAEFNAENKRIKKQRREILEEIAGLGDDIKKEWRELTGVFIDESPINAGIRKFEEARIDFIERRDKEMKQLREKAGLRPEGAAKLGQIGGAKAAAEAITPGQIRAVVSRQILQDDIATLQADIRALESGANTMGTLGEIMERHRKYWQDLDEGQRQYIANLAEIKDSLRFMQDARIGVGLKEGAQAYVQSIGTMREATAQLAQTGIKGVEDAIFSLVTTGTANFREFAKQILENTARMIIQQLILRSVMQIIGAIGGGGTSGGGGASAVNPLSNFNAGVAQYAPIANALGNAYAANGIVPFAMGGVVKRPTMFAFANGGAGRLGLMGEAGPEAIMPLRRLPSGRLGVEAAGGGNAVKVDNITINVENSGEQLSPAAQKQIAGQVRGIVLATLVDQRRGGGVLR